MALLGKNGVLTIPYQGAVLCRPTTVNLYVFAAPSPLS